MKILIDIGHPAHVHLFKNMVFEMSGRGHEFFFTVRESEQQALLLKANGFNYTIIGKKRKGFTGKIFGILIFSFRIYRIARRFHPDLYLSHGSMYAGYAAWLDRKKHIALEDTGNMEQLVFSKPVSDVILSPRSLQVDLGRKHIRYDGFHELAYLHPKRFKPDITVLDELKVKRGEPYIIIRFISWNATHDFRESGLTLSQKSDLIREMTKYARVFISGESSLPSEFEKYSLRIPPDRFHHALFFASMYVGEGATTASESAMLGVPSFYINTISAGTLDQQERDGLVFCFRDAKGLIEKASTILQTPGIREEFRQRRDKMLSKNIDVTSFLAWFVENYPESKIKMFSDPSYQYTFQ